MALVLLPQISLAASTTFNVEANPHVWNAGFGFDGNLGLDTGISLTVGEALAVSVDDVLDTWKYCGPITDCTVDADGVRPALGTTFGPYTNSGYSFTFGALVGRVGLGDMFEIGTAGFSGVADATGVLSLFHWDHNTNNSGSISVTVATGASAVPLPAGLPLLLAGLGAFGLVKRRRKQA